MPQSDIQTDFTPLFHPQSIAVLGASSATRNRSNVIIDRLQRFGFTGPIYPIHPKAKEIDGLTAYASLGETPTPVDYVYVAIPAGAIPDALRAGKGNVKFAHVISSGFGETEDGLALQQELIEAGNESGIRILGPNCPGAYCPAGGLIFVENSSPELGHIGVVSQSGGIAMDIIWSGNERGLRFSAVMTTGNTADVSPSELLEYYLEDPDTH
ncbi:MAG: CoA-binding protein, partial [Rhodospirillales bacterium]